MTYLQPNDIVQVLSKQNTIGFDVKTLNIFCFRGRPKRISHYFETAHLRLSIKDDNFVQYKGPTPEDVLENTEFSFSFLFTSNSKSVPLNVFNQTCIGIETVNEYQVLLEIIPYDSFRIICLLTGIVLILASAKLSENEVFFYICGVSFGVCTSFLILIYFVSKVLPRKPMMYGAMLGGWALVLYFGQMIWQNLQMLLHTYRDYLLYYCLATGLISFIVCYRYGPPTDKRSKNLIKWGLQGAALLAIWNSSDLKEISLVIWLGVLSMHYSPRFSMPSWLRWPGSKKSRLITMEEYERQGVLETAKALEELKRFCSSPECNQWRTIRKLKDPSRFASFIDGDSHLTDNEIIDHEIGELNMSSEEDDLNDSEQSDQDVVGDQLISEDDYDEDRRRRQASILRKGRTPLNGNNLSGRSKSETVDRVGNGHRRLIPNSNFRAEYTPIKRAVTRSPRTNRFHLTDDNYD